MLNQNQFAGGTFINQTKDIIISFMTAKAVVTGEYDAGNDDGRSIYYWSVKCPDTVVYRIYSVSPGCKISLERLGEINDKRMKKNLMSGKTNEVEPGKAIVLKNVTFQYEGPGSPTVLKKIDLEIPANKITAIVGTSGSGKSTLIKLMLGFYKPVEGEIALGGHLPQ